jgi:hydrogenase-4 component E
VPIVAFQSLILTFIVVLMWGETGGSHLLIVALFTLGVKGIAIPIILYYTIQKTGIERRVERITSKYISFLIALALSLFGFYVPSHLHLPQSVPNEVFLPVSIILVLLGTFSMIDHKKAIMQGVGLIILENGLFLLSESMSHGMPLLVELGIFFDVFVTVVVIGILSFRIHSTFGSLNTERMQNLKG